jgi:DNA-directed RNA polymerase subunit K/omega
MTFDTIEDIQNNCKDEKHSSRVMTKYEKTNIVGLRIEQLSFGSKCLLNDDQLKLCNSIEDVAKKELELNLLPFIIQRQICEKKFEYFKLQDMIIHED